MYLTKASLLSVRRAYERQFGRELTWSDATLRKVARDASRREDLLPRLHAYAPSYPWQYVAFLAKYHIVKGKLWQGNRKVRENTLMLYDVSYRRLDVEYLLKHQTWPEGASYG